MIKNKNNKNKKKKTPNQTNSNNKNHNRLVMQIMSQNHTPPPQVPSLGNDGQEKQLIPMG